MRNLGRIEEEMLDKDSSVEGIPTIDVFKCLSFKRNRDFFQKTVLYIVFDISQYYMQYKDINVESLHTERSRKRPFLAISEE